MSILQRFFKSLLNIKKILSDCHQIKTKENKFKRPVRSEGEVLLDNPPLKKDHSKGEAAKKRAFLTRL